MKGSPQLTDLNQNFIQLAQKKTFRIISFGETVPTPMFGIDMNFVQKESANLGIGEHFYINTNHINVCKPDCKESLIYEKFVELIAATLQIN